MEINPRAPLVARKEIFIQASPEAVWKIQTDIGAWKEWQPDISKSQIDGELVPGSVFRWTSGGIAVTSTLQGSSPDNASPGPAKPWVHVPGTSGFSSHRTAAR